jgi:SagB-type dehydrogenase family enzyme
MQFTHILLSSALLAFACSSLNAQESLPAPQKTGGKPLTEALAARATSRAFDESAPDLSKQELSNLLWSAFGINREDGHRTAPSALNRQDITIYVLLKSGAFTYDAAENRLVPVVVNGKPVSSDIRALGGRQDFVAKAAVTLVYVSDFAKLGKGATAPATNADAREMAGVDAGAISQNAALFCAAEGLLTGVRMSIDKEKLGTALGLSKTQWIVLAQSVGKKSGAK